jgi:alpha-amylase
MSAVVFYFQVHQPYRLRPCRSAGARGRHDYFDDGLNQAIMRRVADKCYLPMNATIGQLIDGSDGRFRCAFSITGTALDQMETWAPDALDSFRALAATGAVEFLCETSHHSLAFAGDRREFEAQIEDQRARVTKLFGSAPRTFRNTELVIDDSVAETAQRLGFVALLGEGADRLLRGRTPRVAYRLGPTPDVRLLLRDYRLSDDIGFRFSDRKWECYPLFAETYARWLADAGRHGDFIGLYMDYETFGEHQWRDTGIFDFMRHLPDRVFERSRLRFETPAQVAARVRPMAALDAPAPVSWADEERDLSAWLGNPMQRAAHETLYRLLPAVRDAAAAGRPELLRDWRRLSTSDHVYYMCTKFASDQDVHDYFSPYPSPHDAFMNYMNVLEDLADRTARATARRTSALPRRDRAGAGGRGGDGKGDPTAARPSSA